MRLVQEPGCEGGGVVQEPGGKWGGAGTWRRGCGGRNPEWVRQSELVAFLAVQAAGGTGETSGTSWARGSVQVGGEGPWLTVREGVFFDVLLSPGDGWEEKVHVRFTAGAGQATVFNRSHTSLYKVQSLTSQSGSDLCASSQHDRQHVPAVIRITPIFCQIGKMCVS